MLPFCSKKKNPVNAFILSINKKVYSQVNFLNDKKLFVCMNKILNTVQNKFVSKTITIVETNAL